MFFHFVVCVYVCVSVCVFLFCCWELNTGPPTCYVITVLQPPNVYFIYFFMREMVKYLEISGILSEAHFINIQHKIREFQKTKVCV